MVTFDDKLHPKFGLRIRFKYQPRAFQYLEYFNITIHYPVYKFIPLDLTFNNSSEFYQFLYTRGIVYDETEIELTSSKIVSQSTIVNAKRIYEVEENITKYLLNYKYYSINEVAEMLSFSRPTVYKLVNNQTLKAIRIHSQLRINHLDLIAFINKDNQQ